MTTADSADRRIEQARERAGEAGDELAQAVDRHRDELGMPPEPADGEDVAAPTGSQDGRRG